MDAAEVVKAYHSAELKESDLEAIAERSTQLLVISPGFIAAFAADSLPLLLRQKSPIF